MTGIQGCPFDWCDRNCPHTHDEEGWFAIHKDDCPKKVGGSHRVPRKSGAMHSIARRLLSIVRRNRTIERIGQ